MYKLVDLLKPLVTIKREEEAVGEVSIKESRSIREGGVIKRIAVKNKRTNRVVKRNVITLVRGVRSSSLRIYTQLSGSSFLS